MASAPPPAFDDPAAVARYAEGPPRAVPGYGGLLPMADILLAERVPDDGRILVVGAGGGLELDAFARRHAGWRFEGVDPSAPMLQLAAARLGERLAQVRLHLGLVDDAPDGPFDGATCLLTGHFVPRAQRGPMAAAIHRRLKPGAPYVSAHLSVDDTDGGRDAWLGRYAAFLAYNGADPRQAAATRGKIERELTILTPAEDEALLREAGFGAVRQFFMGFAFRGWVAYA